jgi:integrase
VAEEEMPELFAAIHKVPAEDVTKLALYFLILTAARTGEMRFATWGEIQNARGGKVWRLSGERMKMSREHAVPLSRQAQKVLELAQPLRASRDAAALVFPGFTRHGALSDNALLALLARAGFYGRQTAHGFRASFSTWAHEREANPDVIELCLAHVQGDIRGVYNDAKYIPQRRELLQAWADQCTEWGMKL